MQSAFQDEFQVSWGYCVRVCVCVPYGMTKSPDRDKGVWLTSCSSHRLGLIIDMTRTCGVNKCVSVCARTWVRVVPPEWRTQCSAERRSADTAKADRKKQKQDLSLLWTEASRLKTSSSDRFTFIHIHTHTHKYIHTHGHIYTHTKSSHVTQAYWGKALNKQTVIEICTGGSEVYSVYT